MQRIASYTNRRGDIESTVTQLDNGQYSVQVIDVETETTLPIAVLFVSLDSAFDYAQRCVTDNPSETDDLPF